MTSLREEVEALALPAGRVVGTPGHERARRHLEDRLRALDLSPYQGETIALPYRASGEDFCNLIAVARGRDRTLAPILIGAHYDSVIAFPCADDNAAAVAIALSAGEHFRRQPVERDVIIALFDAEEPGYFRTAAMGSIRFYEDQRRAQGFHAALIMDLVGHDVPLPSPELEHVAPHFSQLLFLTGAESHPALPAVVRDSRVLELPVVATLNRRVGDMSDHGVFRSHGVPYLFLSCGRWAHYHQPSDTPDRLNYEKMGRIRDYLARLAQSLDGTTLYPAGERPGHEVDTTAFEIALINEALGEKGMRMLLSAIGLSRLETTAHLDALASRLQAYFDI
jgi:Peptidase family M28